MAGKGRDSPLVTVIIPNFNKEHAPEAVLSVLDQTYSNIELLVMDGASEDRFLTPLRNINDDRFFLISEKDRGISHARNKGLKQARGEFLAYLDSDDVWERDKLKQQMDVFKTHPDVDMVYTDAYLIDYSGRFIVHEGERSRRVSKEEAVYREPDYPHIYGMRIIPSSVIHRRKMTDELGGFDEDLPTCEDWDFFLRMEKSFKFHRLRKPLIRKRAFFDVMEDGTRKARGSTAATVESQHYYKAVVLRKHLDNYRKLHDMIPDMVWKISPYHRNFITISSRFWFLGKAHAGFMVRLDRMLGLLR